MSGRWFIGAAATVYQPESGFEDRPELAEEVDRAAGLFTRIGYRRVPGFGANVTVQDFRNQLRVFLTSPDRRDDDVVVIYYTGHGAVVEGQLLLPMADTTADVAFTALATGDLTGRLLSGGVVVQKILFVLDTCHAGAAGRELADGATQFLHRLRGMATSPSVAVVVGARPYEQAEAGAFTQALVAAVDHPASGGHEPEFLPLDGLVEIVNATTPSWQHARLFLTGDGVTPFVPNPRVDHWLRGLDLRTQAARRVQADRLSEVDSHILPRAQGLDSLPAGADDVWLFTGRHRALAQVCEWLRSPAGHAQTMIVTGAPGSGKSSVLSRLFVLAHSRYRNRVPNLHTLPAATLPDLGAITRFILARGMTPDDLMAALCEACKVEATTSPGTLLAAVSTRTEPVTIIVDAVDEALAATSPDRYGGRVGFPIVERVLAPLVTASGRTPLRLLLGTRTHLLDPLGEPAAKVDLDDRDYADRDSVRRYARDCLVSLSDQSPYRHQSAGFLDAVAEAVAEAAGDSFLVALITARGLALQPNLVNPHDRQWRRSLPRAAADAMRQDLDTRLGADARRARDLLLPLAYAQGSGLPWETLWPRLASALAGTRYTNADIDWLIDVAGFYIIETSSDGRSTYRLYHESLAEHLRSQRDDPAADHTVITDTLTSGVDRRPDGHPEWDSAHPYAATHLAVHAAQARRLDHYLDDPRYLLAAHRSSLLAALPAATTPNGHAAADAYQRADSHLTTCPPPYRPAYLQLAARCGRAPRLADAITTDNLPLAWSTDWASWRLQAPHRTLTSHTDGVNAVAVGQLDGRTITASGSSDQTVQVWDAATGTPLGDPFTGHTGWVQSVAIGQLDGRTIIASGSSDGTVRVWDAATGELVGDPFTDHTDGVNAVAFGQLDGRTIIASGSDDRTVRVWDAATGELVGDPFTDHTSAVNAVAIGQLDGRTIIASGSSDGTVRVWDAATGIPLGDPFTGHTDVVNAVAFGQLNGRTIIASGSDDRTVRVRDAATGIPLGNPFTGHTDWVRSVAIGQLDGRTIIASGSDDQTVRVRDAATGELVGDPFTGHTGAVNAVAFGQLNGRTIIASGSDDGTVRVWDAATGMPLGNPFTGHTEAVRSVAIGQLNGRTIIASGSSDGTVRVRDAATGELVCDPFIDYAGWVQSVAIGQLDGRTIIASGSNDGTVQVWDAATGEPLADPFTDHYGWVQSVAIGQLDGHTIIASGSGDGIVQVWDAATGELVCDPFTDHTSIVNAVAIGQLDGRTIIASGSSDRTVRVRDAATGELVCDPFTDHTSAVNAVAFGQLDGRTIIASGSSDRTVRVWDAATGELVCDPFTGHTGWVRSVAIGQLDGRTIIASGSDDRTVRVRDAATGTPLGDPFTGHTGAVNAVAVGQLNGRTIIVSGSGDGTVRVWEAATGTPLGDPFTGHTDWVRSVAIGQLDGRTIIASGSDDRTVRVRDAATGELVCNPFTGHTDWIRSVAIGQLDGHTIIASGSNDGTVQVRDAATGELVCNPFTDHTDAVRSVAIDQLDGHTIIASGSNDGTVRVWDAATGEPLGDPFTDHTGAVNAVAVGQLDGHTIVASGSGDGTVRVWDAPNDNPNCNCYADRRTTHGLPELIAFSSPVSTITLAAPLRLVVGTQLGVVAMRLRSQPCR